MADYVAPWQKMLPVFSAVPRSSSIIERNLPPAIPPDPITIRSFASVPEKPISDVLLGNQTNVLNNYRSYTYNFTLSAISDATLADQTNNKLTTLETNMQSAIILKSGGKGYAGISTKLASTLIEEEQVTVTDKYDKYINSAITQRNEEAKIAAITNPQLISKFNESSSGKFDMFLENVEIKTLMTYTPGSSGSFPVTMSFDVIEPYSISGFFEALHSAAIAEGYSSYATARYILKIEFQGYDDSSDVTSSHPIPQSTRYFIISFTNVEMEITERGTKYHCAAIPSDELAFGSVNKIKRPINAVGGTVKTILTDLCKKLSADSAESDKSGNAESASTLHDTYSIIFPSWNKTTGWDRTTPNKISEAVNTKILRDSMLQKFPDSGNFTNDQEYSGMLSLSNANQVTLFANGMNVSDCISAIIRDSEYLKTILKDVDGNTDEYGMIDYFLIKTEITDIPTINLVARKLYQNFNYVVYPHRIHYTSIPNYQGVNIDSKKLQKMTRRAYDYIYTGKNVDILNFRLKFNSTYYENMPFGAGNNTSASAVTGAAAANTLSVKNNPNNPDLLYSDVIGKPVLKTSLSANESNPSDSGTGGQRQDDPFSVLARNMHHSITNSEVSMTQCELEIIGDPFYLVSYGMGEYNPIPAGPGISEDGQALYIEAGVFIVINFRNPSDINSLANGGMMKFDSNKTPFSGIYQVSKVTSILADGQFKQRLTLIRIPGQISGSNLPITNIAEQVSTTAKEIDQSSPDTTTADNPSGRVTDANGLLQLERGIANPGLPGVLSNFTSAVGGIGSTANNLLNQVSGAVSGGLSQLTSAASTLGDIVPGGVDQLASGIRLQAAGIVSGAQQSVATVIGAATNVSAVANIAAGITSKISALTSGIPTDPAGIAGKLGINAAQLSGLGTGLQSKLIAQATDLAKTIPANVNLAAASAQGIVLDYIPKDKLANLPATAPFSVAPAAAIDTQFLSSIVAHGGPQALANAYGVSDISKISSSLLPATVSAGILTAIPPGISNALSGGISAITSGVAAINNIQNAASAVTTKLGSISQSASPLTTLLSKSGS